MGRRAACLIACGLVESFVVACATRPLDPDTALGLARDQSRVLAAAWQSDIDVVDARVSFEFDAPGVVAFAAGNSYQEGRFCGAKLMQKLAGQNGLLKLVKDERVPATALAPAHVAVEYALSAAGANATYDPGRKRVRIRVLEPVIEAFGEFVERGSVTAMAKFEIGFRPTDAGARLFRALEELRKEAQIQPDQLYSPGDDILVQLLAAERNMKRRETRYVRYERADAGWQVAKMQ